MSGTWPPPAGSDETAPGTPPGPEAATGPTPPGPEAATSPIPLGPAATDQPLLPAPPYAGPYPRYGGATPYPPAGAYPGYQYPPTSENPAVGGGWPTPPAGTWAIPPGAGWGAGAVPPAGGWGAGPGGPTPPFGTWPPAPGPVGSYPTSPTPKRRRSPVIAAATVVIAAAVVAGAGLGRLVWPSGSPASATSSPNVVAPGGSGSSGSETSPFGSGSSGSETSPFGSSGSSGNSSTGAGAPSDISSIAAKVDPGLVDINTNLSYEDEQAAGTGMVLTSTGEILTNNHVIDGATSISVTDVGNGKTYSANVVGYDRTGDVAVIKLVDASGLQTVSTSSGTAAVGQAVVGVGNAGGTGGTPSAAGGSITAVNQAITASDDGGGNAENLTGLIETNAGIEPGDSGGSLTNTSGQVVGMDTAASANNGYEDTSNQGYAIPIGTALAIAKRIEAGDVSSVVHIGATGFLGVEVASSSSSDSSGDGGLGGQGFGDGGSSDGGSSASGATIEGVVSGSPADRAGLADGDVITAVNGTTINSATDLSDLLQSDHPGSSVQIQWTNESGQSSTATVKLTSGPPA
jgi:S1-C subfamily serine protease